ncbi:MAG: thioredoxin [Phycisphaera sp.]|nr:thioredoxin [Phycisphaera sp.]
MAIEFTDDNFASEVLESDTPVLVDFWAVWCQPCRMLAPVIDAVAEQFGDAAKVGKLDIDNNRDTAIKYQISAVPTVMLFKGGQPIKTWVGMANKDEFISAINNAQG